MTIRTIRIALLPAALLLVNAIAMADSYLWPLPASTELTSGFCSYRSSHFHSGIDIRTFGKTGYKAVAIADCHVWRISTNWYGYGKALYLRLDDGRIAVYGHLLKFTPEIDEYVRQQQILAHRFKTDLYPDADLFKFKAGDLVAYTGESGAGAPHLHFEIRSGDNTALSPLEFYPEYADSIAPSVRSVLVTPISASDSRINGRSKSVQLTSSSAKGSRLARDTLTVYGPVGFAVDCIDRIPGSSVDLSPARIEMAVDSVSMLKFVSTFDSIPFDRWGEINLERDYILAQKGERQVHNLYLLPGVEPIVVTDLARNNGWIRAIDSSCTTCLSPGFHRVIISMTDRAGNRSKTEIPMIVKSKPNPPFGDPSSPASGDLKYEVATYDRRSHRFRSVGKMDQPEFDSYLRRLSSDGTPAQHDLTLATQILRDGTRFHYLIAPTADQSSPVLRNIKLPQQVLSARAIASSRDPIRIDMEKLYGWCVEQSLILPSSGFAIPISVNPADSSVSVDINQVYSTGLLGPAPGQPLVVGGIGSDKTTVSMADVTVTFEPRDFFAPTVIAIDTSSRIIKGRGLVKLATLNPSDLWLRGSLDLCLPIPHDLDAGRSAVYAIGKDGSASYAGATRTDDGRLLAGVSAFRTYGVLEDDNPPAVRNVTPRDGEAVTSAFARISFRLTDDLSGIGDDTNVEITVDGEWVVPDYDIESLWVTAYPSNSLAFGSHKLVIRVRDRAGNEKALMSTFKRVKSAGGKK